MKFRELKVPIYRTKPIDHTHKYKICRNFSWIILVCMHVINLQSYFGLFVSHMFIGSLLDISNWVNLGLLNYPKALIIYETKATCMKQKLGT